ncbi:MAG: cytochrome c [Myxococcales bacterium]|jgi:mono/diheme cytochrome c family protein
MPGRIQRLALLLACAALSLACNETPSDLRPWRATDHDHTENPNADQVQVTDAGTGNPGHGLDDVTIVAWQQNCTSCHGSLGRGDGPQGQLVHASDLSRPDWQATVTDEQIAATIHQGRGRMPAFNLPDATVARLVALIRMLDLNRMQQVMGAATAQASAGASAAKAPPAAHSAAVPAHSAPAPGAPQRVGR